MVSIAYGILYLGISIVVLVGTVVMVMGMAAEK